MPSVPPHRSKLIVRLTVLAVALCAVAPAPAATSVSARTVALESALRNGGFYAGTTNTRVDRRLTQVALGSTTLRLGAQSRAVAELQLALAWQGFPSGTIDGGFGPRLERAVRRFQRARGLGVDGIASTATIDALRVAPRLPAITLGWPLLAPLGDPFGPRGDRFHAGIDLPAERGTPVLAAAPGRVTWAGPREGGWGTLVTVAHPGGVRTMYAHLSTIRVRVGDWIAGGTVLGSVGSTGDATGPHLHFEVRVRGAAFDPLRVLVPLPAEARTR